MTIVTEQPVQLLKKLRSIASVSPTRDQLFQKNHLGCLLDGHFLFAAHVDSTPNHLTIDLLASIDLEQHVKPVDILQDALGKKKCAKAYITTAFSTSKTLTRSLELQKLKTSEMDAIIKHQIEPQLPYPITEAVLDT